ncbi:MAG: cytidylate kinase-like family protein [Lachnospiraceae bacterium]|nr:cytidylate kinase-like family protein [Lachnospiraceae bacterium]
MMKEHQIITIGRELGSGGREIGIRLSEELGIPFYDREILEEAAKSSGFTRELFEKNDEKPTNSFLFTVAMGMNYYGGGFQKPLALELYFAQFDAMRRFAADGPGIFIGRCADYVLSEMPDLLNVFIHADLKTRVERTAAKHGISEKEAEGMCLRSDKDRSAYYNYYSNHEWGDGRFYDLSINTGKLGIEKSVELIKACLE